MARLFAAFVRDDVAANIALVKAAKIPTHKVSDEGWLGLARADSPEKSACAQFIALHNISAAYRQ